MIIDEQTKDQRNQEEQETPTPVDEANQMPSDEAGEKPAELLKLEQEVGELKDKYMRAVAEMENMRRRMERERVDLTKYALESVFKDVLPALDSLEQAIPDTDEAAPAIDGSAAMAYYEGMKMVKKQLLDILKKHGLQAIDSRGVEFDPNVHQAVQRVETDSVRVATVGEEYARGYMLNGRLLRPAMVSVLTPVGG